MREMLIAALISGVILRCHRRDMNKLIIIITTITIFRYSDADSAVHFGARFPQLGLVRPDMSLDGGSPEEPPAAAGDAAGELVLVGMDALVLAVVAHAPEELLAVLALQVGFVRRELVGCDAAININVGIGINININIGIARLHVDVVDYGAQPGGARFRRH